MLRPAGYFRSFCCPFDARGCRRPHCQYRHGAGRRLEPPPAPQQPLRGSPVLGLGNSIQELERINREIQSVKTEVEEQQKKLYYSLVQDNLKNDLNLATNGIRRNISISPGKGICNTPVRDKDDVISISKETSKSSKYIIDRTCPATDLEYDPLLNYSAGLRSSLKEEEENDAQYSKHVKMFPSGKLQGPTKKSPCGNRHLPPRKRLRSASPIKREIKFPESDDDMLLRDALTENALKKPRIFKEQNRQENESFGTDVVTVQDSGTSEILNREGKRPEDIFVDLGNISQSDGNKNELKPSDEDSYLRDIEVRALNVGSTLDDQTKSYHLTKESNRCQMKFKTKEALKEDSVNVSVKMYNVSQQVNNKKALLKDTTKTSIDYKGSSEDGVVLLQKTCKKVPEHLEEWSMPFHKKPKVCNAQSFPSPALGDHISPDRASILQNSGENGGDKNMHIDTEENEIIVLDSTDKDGSEEGNELSESEDTMEECQRIFNEFAEHEAKKEKMPKQALVAQAEVGSDLRSSMLPGQKKRIAHTAKFDVNTTKEITVPFRAPLPQQTGNSRIMQARQQAVQVSTAIKSGQAFVAATCGHKKNASVIPAAHMVCLNVFEVQPVATSSSQVNVLLPENALTAVPCRLSNNPAKRTTPMPIKALLEEKAIYDRCGGKNMYLNIAVNTVKKLRNHGSVSTADQTSGSKSTTKTGFRKQEEKKDFTGIALYRVLKDYALTEEQLIEHGFPQPNPEKPGSAVLCSGTIKPAVSDFSKRVCCRCGEIYAVTSSGRHARKEECNYHSGKVLQHKVPGGLETWYSCCEGVVGSPGCQVARLHVHDGRNENIDGFVKTFIKPPPLDGNHGVFALDCEMCYTTHGLELSRVAVVDPSLHVVYDAFVKPDNEIIDYNTRFSGVTAEDMKDTVASIRDVQAVLLNLFSADTFLIGHSLPNDLFALKMFHSKIVDISVVFPHRLGLPHRRALRTLMADYLQQIIQVGGHDCSEDATACMELMLWKVKDAKGRR
ncbi:RNA exonuclease 1 homolog [Varanus komodoensis]|uniref:RNA exonuclease 1 homolog n=1 Tax=Varanus komodoensis TaxID=61221 RepID=UPI001CF7E2FF|nr:RNA exonuclease 1 homolog [Varanus komodoensis]